MTDQWRPGRGVPECCHKSATQGLESVVRKPTALLRGYRTGSRQDRLQGPSNRIESTELPVDPERVVPADAAL